MLIIWNLHFGLGVRVVLCICTKLPCAPGGDVGRDEGALVLVGGQGGGSSARELRRHWHPGVKFDTVSQVNQNLMEL